MSDLNLIFGYLIVRLCIMLITIICKVSPFMSLSLFRFRGIALDAMFGNFKHVLCRRTRIDFFGVAFPKVGYPIASRNATFPLVIHHCRPPE
jgi:hypothetical protein